MMKQYLALLFAVLVAYAPTLCWALPSNTFFRRSTATVAATLPLDLVPGATGAYSVSRKLRAAYSGPCVRVRRDDNGLEVDIGFSGDDINTAAIAAHCAGTTGYVRTIYDQGTGARDLGNSNTARQPIIYQAGAVLTGTNGRVVALFDTTDDVLSNSTYTFGATVSFHAVLSVQATSASTDTTVNMGSNARVALRIVSNQWNVNATSSVSSGVTATNGVAYFVSAGGNTAGPESIAVNGGTVATGTGGTNGATGMFLGSSTNAVEFLFYETLFYDAAYDDTVKTTLFTNADAYYAIP